MPKLHTAAELPKEDQSLCMQAMCSPLSVQRLQMQESLIQPDDKIRLEQAGLVQDEALCE